MLTLLPYYVDLYKKTQQQIQVNNFKVISFYS